MVELRKRKSPPPPEPPDIPLHGRNTRLAERALSAAPPGHHTAVPERSGVYGPRTSIVLSSSDLPLRRARRPLSSEEDVLGHYDEGSFALQPSRRLSARLRPGVNDSEEDDMQPDFGDEDLDLIETVNGGPGSTGLKDEDSEFEDGPHPLRQRATTTRSGRQTRRVVIQESEDDDSDPAHPRSSRPPPSKRLSREMRGFVEPDDPMEDAGYDEPEQEWEDRESKRARLEQLAERRNQSRLTRKEAELRALTRGPSQPQPRRTRNSMAAAGYDDQEYEEEVEESDDNLGYQFRKRKEVNYKLPTLEQLAKMDSKARKLEKHKKKKSSTKRSLPFNMTGTQLSRLFGEPVPSGESSDDDRGTPRKRMYPGGMMGSGLLAGAAGGNLFDLTAGTPSNLGRISGAANLADTDPLLPSTNISFDNVGGLDTHIQQLKEMVSLPLLYPEIFRRFNITPPRGVLFHGPPGTGKTLLARALAASCSSQGQQISFFMRKGADCLSKWVGEAERQLRLLFEEARASQPAIIFFDEIDGLAPVRSSKQEQIHASIVSTLLALMDGMDGRGQVIVIGATNRPDAIDPALRRPGRFDREFYFPLPNADARRKILEIHTQGWDPALPVAFLDELASMTKGYGGADLRALCTEAALNAVQRRYPQIYKSKERLVIEPGSIRIGARDFVLAAKRLIPSSTRATSSLAAPLPAHLQPLLNDALERCKTALSACLPDIKTVSALEDAEFEQQDIGITGGDFAREKDSQAFEALRIYRPRLLVHGQEGMGQTYLGPAVLHHLEGFHVQSLDLGNLVSDSTRTQEAACVQLFTEARRHRPSIIYIPSLNAWANTVADSVKATVKGLLDSLDPSERILLLAVVDSSIDDLPRDVRGWFGILKSARIDVGRPQSEARQAYFDGMLATVSKPPNEFADAVPRKKRELEQLAIAPPPPPRQPTIAELEQQLQNDQRLLNTLKFLLGPILSDLKKRYKRFTNPVGEPGKPARLAGPRSTSPGEAPETADGVRVNGAHHLSDEDDAEGGLIASDDDERDHLDKVTNLHAATGVESGRQKSSPPPPYVFHDIDLDRVHSRLYYNRYLTPSEFLADIGLIVENAEHDDDDEQRLRALQMQNHAQLMVDQSCDRQFQIECAKAAVRFAERSKEAKARALREDSAEQDEPNGAGSSPGARAGQKRKSGDEGDAVDARVTKRARSVAFEGLDEPVDSVIGGITEQYKKSDGSVDNGAQGDTHAAAIMAPSASTNGADGSVLLISGSDRGPDSQPALPTSGDDINISDVSMSNGTGALETVGADIDGAPPDRKVEVDGADLSTLASFLRNDTSNFNVEDLEQLRAACYDRIWHYRAQWDRRPLVSELRALAQDLAMEVVSHHHG